MSSFPRVASLPDWKKWRHRNVRHGPKRAKGPTNQRREVRVCDRWQAVGGPSIGYDKSSSLLGHPPGAADYAQDHRVAALDRQAVQRLGRNRANRLGIAPPRTPRPTLRHYVHFRHRCPLAPESARPGTFAATENTPSVRAEPPSAASRTADHLNPGNAMPRSQCACFRARLGCTGVNSS